MQNQNRVAVRLTNPLQNLLDSFFVDNLPEVFPGDAAPATNIAETAEAFTISFALPGVAEEDIQLDLHDGRLQLTAERRDEPKAEGEITWHRVEQRYGKWARTLQLPDSANPAAVEARYRNGILTVVIGKHPKARPVRVQIQVK